MATRSDDLAVEPVPQFREPQFRDIQFVQVRYTDLPGRFRAKYLCSNAEKEELSSFFERGMAVDGSSVKGFADIDDSDLLLLPDKATLRQAPISRYKVATIIADVYRGFGKGRLLKDPRFVTELLEEEMLKRDGLSCQVGPEVECFIFDDILFVDHENGSGGREDNGVVKGIDLEIVSLEQHGRSKYPIRRKDGYDAPPFQDSLCELRFEIADILKRSFSIKVTNLNHEVASSGQIEINFKHSTLTKAADNVQIYKDVVRNVAKRHNKIANFMPKPIFNESNPREGDNGSGMHTSISLWEKSYSSSASDIDGIAISSSNNSSSDTDTTNIFYDPDDAYAELSQKGRYFIGGIMDHASSLAALVAPTVNSYHRMVPGFEAPVYVAWSKANRSAVIRVPTNDKKNAASKRIEFRAPDPSANPYLAFSAIVLAGLDGIKKKKEPGDPVNGDIYKMTDSERKSRGIRSLPGALDESLEHLNSDSSYLSSCYSEDLLDTYKMIKRQEIKDVGSKKRQEFMFYYDI
jgi:glutamine synthetase